MVCWISIICFVLALTKICGSDSPDEIGCPLEALIPPKTVRPENETRSVCACEERWCLPLCCPMGSFLSPPKFKKCISIEDKTAPNFPPHHDHVTLKVRSGQLKSDDFHVFSRDPCRGRDHYVLDPEVEPLDEFKLLANGSIYLPASLELPAKTMHYNEFCFAAIVDEPVYKLILCDEESFEIVDEDAEVELPDAVDEDPAAVLRDPVDAEDKTPHRPINVQYWLIFSVPFLFVTFVVYSIIPELRNMHGSTLRAYVGVSVIRDIHQLIVQLVDADDINPDVCIILAYGMNFFSLASFFWLNVMCFDIWWTFGGFRSLRGCVNQRERKKFIIYSSYAWGSSSLITGICLIMDFSPFVPRNWIRPGFGERSCWFRSDAAQSIYFFVPAGLTVLCNLCLFVLTSIKIIQHKKAMAHDLNGMDSRRHEVNRQWFNLYLKLFIVMGINWSMDILSWILKNDTPKAVWVLTDLINALQGVIIFVIFVCKGKIKRLILKRLGCRNRKFKGRNSTMRSGYQSSTSRTSTFTASVMVPLEENKPYSERMQITTDDSDCGY